MAMALRFSFKPFVSNRGLGKTQQRNDKPQIHGVKNSNWHGFFRMHNYYTVLKSFPSAREFLGTLMTDTIQSSRQSWLSPSIGRNFLSFQGSVKFVQTTCRISVPGTTIVNKESVPPKFLRDKKMVPDSDPPSMKDINHLYQLFDQSTKLVVLTGAGISTESGIPDYRSPNGAYSSGFKPITHQKLRRILLNGCGLCWDVLHLVSAPFVEIIVYLGKERSRDPVRHILMWIMLVLVRMDVPHLVSILFSKITLYLGKEFLRSSRARRRYWARSYVGWRRFTAAQPSAAHNALASLENASWINFMITQNVDRLHHRAGSNPLELHGTVYSVICVDCGFSLCRSLFQDQLKDLNPKWAAAIESLDHNSPGSDKSFGMNQRPDGDIEIDEKFWEEEFHIPTCQKCNGVLKPDVVFFGDNVPKDKADKAMEAAKGCDAFLVLGSSLMTMSAFRLVRAAHEAGAATAIVNVGLTRADGFVPLKINARLGEILPRLLDVGSLSIPAL